MHWQLCLLLFFAVFYKYKAKQLANLVKVLILYISTQPIVISAMHYIDFFPTVKCITKGLVCYNATSVLGYIVPSWHCKSVISYMACLVLGLTFCKL